jgi:hypothetical protein
MTNKDSDYDKVDKHELDKFSAMRGGRSGLEKVREGRKQVAM